MIALTVDQDSECLDPRRLPIPFRPDVDRRTARSLVDPDRQQLPIDGARLLPARSDKEDDRSPSARYVMERSEGVTHALEAIMNMLARSRPTEARADLASIAPGSPVGAAVVWTEVFDGSEAILV